MGKEDIIRGLIRAVGDGATMDLGRIVGNPAKFGKLPPHLQLAAIRGEVEPFLHQAGQGAGLDPRITRRMGMMKYTPNFTVVPDHLRRDRTMLAAPRQAESQLIPDDMLESAILAQMVPESSVAAEKAAFLASRGGPLARIDPGYRAYAGQYGPPGPTGMIPYSPPGASGKLDGGGLVALAAAAAAGLAGMDSVMSPDETDSDEQIDMAELARASETPPLGGMVEDPPGDMGGLTLDGPSVADLAAETSPPPVVEAIPTEEELQTAADLQELEQALGPEDFAALQFLMQTMPLDQALRALIEKTPLGTP